MAARSKSAYQVTLPSDRELVMTRMFNAPRELVFKAHVDPTLIPQWWGPRGNTTIVDKLDVRPGGAWRFVLRRDDGSGEVVFFGEFREIVPPERFTWTFGFEGMPGSPGLETYVFEEHAGQTTLMATAVFNTLEERDGVIASGMEAGANESADRLEELLARLQA
jgi:uncharacterized protein YndB with AHSA1/START domain